jgi:hypothetical protein
MGRHTLIDVLEEIFIQPKKLQSNYVRLYAYEVARLASLGLITTAYKKTYGDVWRCNHKGLLVLAKGS